MTIELIFGSNTFELSEESKGKYDLPLFIKGKSVNSGWIKNKNFYLPDSELDNIATTLREGLDGSGSYILKDHGYKSLNSGKSVDLLVGKITEATRIDRNVFYKGRIEDKDLAEKMRKGLVSASSAGLKIGKAYCSICSREYGDPQCQHLLGQEYSEGFHDNFKSYLSDFDNKAIATIIGKDIEATEQSIVLFPAIEGASAIPMNFVESTENYIKEVEGIKTPIEDYDLFYKDSKIILELDKFIEENNLKQFPTLEEIKQYLTDLGYTLLKTEDLKVIEDSLRMFEMQDFCKVHDLEYDERMNGLSDKELALFVETASKLKKSQQVGSPAEMNNSFMNSEDQRKEIFREQIFGVKRTPQQIAEIRKKKEQEKNFYSYHR